MARLRPDREGDDAFLSHPGRRLEPAAQRDHPHHRGLASGFRMPRGAWKLPTEKGDPTHGRNIEQWRRHLERPAQHGGLLKKPRRVELGKRRMLSLGRLQHREFTRVEAADNRVQIAEKCDYLDPAGTRFMQEERTLTFHLLGEARAIDIDRR